jgi:hypothetical protein
MHSSFIPTVLWAKHGSCMALYSRNSTNTLTTYKSKHRAERRHLFYFFSLTKLERSQTRHGTHACSSDLRRPTPSEDTTQERGLRRRRRRAAVLAEVCENVRAAVDDDGAGAAAGTNPSTDLDALLALRVAPTCRDVLALALRRELLVASTAVVAARPRRAWCGVPTHVNLVKMSSSVHTHASYNR